MRPRCEGRAPAPWRNPVYLAATIAQAFDRARQRPSQAYGARELCRHLFPSTAERGRRARPALPYLAVTTMVHESRDITEWIEFHLLQGVERFYLYDNCATNAVERTLSAYIKREIVELTPWPEQRQTGAIADAFSRHRDDVRWLASIDIDEFLFCPTGERVANVLKEYECYPAVAVHWNMFGTSDVARRPDASDVLTTFVRRSGYFGRHSVNRHVKSIVDPWYALEAPPANPHNRPYRVGFAVNEVGCPVRGPRSWPIHAERLRINHYWSKSKAESLRKTARDWTPHPLSSLVSASLNAVEDRAILEVRDRLLHNQMAFPAKKYLPRTLTSAHDLWLANREAVYRAVYRRLPKPWRIQLDRLPLRDWLLLRPRS